MPEQNKETPKTRRNQLTVIAILAGIAAVLIFYSIIHRFAYRNRIPVKVVSVQPLGEVSRKINLTFEFSQNMVKEQMVDQPLDTVAMRFEPQIPGRFKWLSPRTLRFFPDQPLRPATEYSVKVLPEICKRENTYLEGSTRFNFHTEPFRVTDATLNFVFEDTKRSTVRLQAVIDFNYQVDPQELARHLKITHGPEGSGRQIPCDIETKEPGRAMHVLSEPSR